jgi:cell division protein FtsA
VVLTGAGVKMPGVVDLARETLNLPVQIGFPQNFDGVVDKIDDPAYATAIGLAIWGSRFEGQSGYAFKFRSLNMGKTWQSVKNWAKSLLP